MLSRVKVELTAAQRARYANDVAVLWDEAQDSPALLRFLAPFGRPDLGRISRRFLSSNSVSDLVSEGYPAFATWLATMVLRDGAAVNERFDALPMPQWDNSMMLGGLVLGAPLELGSTTRINTLVVAGSLEAPSVRVHAKTLVVAGDLKTKLLVADGCVLVGGAVEADAVLVPASHLSRERDQYAPPRSLGLQVGREVVCRVFDSPRFALSCPVRAEIIVRGVGLEVTPEGEARAREVLASLGVEPSVRGQ